MPPFQRELDNRLCLDEPYSGSIESLAWESALIQGQFAGSGDFSGSTRVRRDTPEPEPALDRGVKCQNPLKGTGNV